MVSQVGRITKGGARWLAGSQVIFSSVRLSSFACWPRLWLAPDLVIGFHLSARRGPLPCSLLNRRRPLHPTPLCESAPTMSSPPSPNTLKWGSVSTRDWQRFWWRNLTLPGRRSGLRRRLQTTFSNLNLRLGVPATCCSATLNSFEKYRQAGATTRAMLVAAAAQRWQVTPSNKPTSE
jgi:hypothetical protein